MHADQFARASLPADLRIAVLLALSDPAERRILNWRMWIPLARTLASPWSTQKLANCRALLEAGQTPPPVRVTRYRLHSTEWYVVGDGNHRTAAAQEAGQEHIDALVGSAMVCTPEHFRINTQTGVLLRSQTDGNPVTVTLGMEPAFIEALRKAGVSYGL